MVGFARACFFALGLSATGQALHLYGDKNYDGRLTAEDINAPGVAYFMANIGESKGRCGAFHKAAELNECNDAEGEVQRNLQYMARLRLDLEEGETLLEGDDEMVEYWIMLSHRENTNNNNQENKKIDIYQYVRLFWLPNGSDENKPTDWQYIKANTEFTASNIIDGINLGIDARDFSRPDAWDGSVIVTVRRVDLETGEEKELASTELRVAPLLTHHNLQTLEEVLTISEKLIDDTQQKSAHSRFVQEVVQFTKGQGGVQKPVRLVDSTNIWIQDWFESGYTSIPGENGQPKVLRVLVKSSRVPDDKSPFQFEDDVRVYTQMRSTNVGATFAPFVKHAKVPPMFLAGTEAMGNLELLPPYTDDDGKRYPYGRVISGKYDPNWMTDAEYVSQAARFLAYQHDKADPLAFDLSWTVNNHIDEILQVLPSKKTASGWALFVVDPVLGTDLLEAHAKAHPEAAAMSHSDRSRESSLGRVLTVQELLDRRGLVKFNKLVGAEVDALVGKLIEVAKIPKENIVRVPVPFIYANPTADRAVGQEFYDGGYFASYMDGSKILYAAPLYGNPINGVVYGSNYLAPIPFGPKLGDTDILQEEATKIFKEHGVEPKFIDDFWSHHIAHGDIHCGTNTIRDDSAQWWLQAGQQPAANVPLGPTTHTEVTAPQ